MASLSNARRLSGTGSLLLAAVALLACSTGPDRGPEEDDLIGGDQARAGQFPSTLTIRAGCTVSKVGPRHLLTAAHCVQNYNRDVRFDFRPGAELRVSNAPAVDSASWDERSLSAFRKVTVARTHVHPAWAELDGDVRVLTPEVPPDVAIIELDGASEAAIADVPEATIDLIPVRPDDALVLNGYGCEEGVAAEKDYSKARLKFKQTRALGLDSQLHRGSGVLSIQEPFARNLERQYVFTPGAGASAAGSTPNDATPRSEEASLCPGDSGGPVYRDDGQARRVVGVNAYYSFRPEWEDESRVSVTNWHARLDGESRFDVAAWLSTIPGVKLEGPAPSDHYAACKDAKNLVCGAIARVVDASFGAAGAAPRYVQDAAGSWRWTQVFKNKRVELEPSTNEPRVTDVFDDTRCAPEKSGKYCGVILGDPEAKTLYTCASGAVKERTICSTVCQSNPSGVPDACAAEGWTDVCAKARKDGRYCGKWLGDDNPKALYQCVGKQTFKKIECAKSCSPQPSGVPDKCAR